MSQSLFAYRAAQRREELQKRQALERRALAVEVRRSLDWRAWLEKQVEQGDEAAKAALRGLRYREQRKSKKYQEQEGIEGEELDPLRKLTVAALHAEVDHKRQLVIYRGQDGREKFTDTGPRIVMQDKADDTLEAALRVAAQKYGGKVDITGSSEFRERAARQAVRLGIKVANADLQAIASDDQARMYTEMAPKWATKENWNSDRALERKSIDFGQEPVFLTTPASVRDYTSPSDKTSDLSPELGDKSTSHRPSSALRQQSAAVPKRQATGGAPHERAKQAMEQALERWVDGDRSGGPVKAFIAEHDRATRQGGDGRKLIAEVVDRVVNRRGEALAAAMRGFIAEMDRQRKRAQGIGR